MRDALVRLGLQEVITYRLTSSEREARRLPEGTPADPMPYIQLANPMVADRVVMRHSLLASLLRDHRAQRASARPAGDLRDRAGVPGGGG